MLYSISVVHTYLFQKSYSCFFVSKPLLNCLLFKTKSPIAVADCSKQSETVKSGPVHVRLWLSLKRELLFQIPNPIAYYLILYDRVVEYSQLTSTVRRNILSQVKILGGSKSNTQLLSQVKGQRTRARL